MRTQVALQIRAGQLLITANLWPLTTHICHIMIIVASGFSKKSCFIIFRSCHAQMLFKTGVVRNVTIFSGKHLCLSLILVKFQVLQPATLFQPCPKRDFKTSVFLKILRNFYKQLFLYNTSGGCFCQFDKVTVQ